jgi:phage-related minor tail protein
VAQDNIVSLILRARDESAGKAVRQLEGDMKNLQRTSRETSFALRQVPMQFTDIVVSLAAGQNPLQVMLQQGGQLKDLFGGIGPAARALGSYIIGLVNPLTLAAAGVIGLTAAFEGGQRETKGMNLALELTNNFAAQTAASMRELAEEINRTRNISIGAAKDIVNAVVASGRFGPETSRRIALLAPDFAAATKQDIDDVKPLLIKLFDDPVKGAAELNKQMHLLNTVDQEYIEHLVRIGELESARLVLIDKTQEQLKGQSENVTLLGWAWDAVGNAVSRAWNYIKQIGTDNTLQEQLEEAKQKLAEIDDYTESINPGARARQQAIVNNLQTQVDKVNAIAKAESDAAIEAEKRTLWLKEIQKSEAYNLQVLQDQLTLVKSQIPANQQEAVLQQARITELNKKILDAQGIGQKAIQAQIRGYETLRDKAIRAYEDAGEAAQKAAQRAQDALAKAAAIRLNAQNRVLDLQLQGRPDDEQDAIRNQALERALQRADNLRAQANYQRYLGNTTEAERQLELADRQVESAQQLADKLKDQRLAQQQIEAAAESAARNEETRASIEQKNADAKKKLQEDLLEQINANGDRIEALRTRLEAINGTPLKIQTDNSELDATLAKLMAIHRNISPADAANFTGVYDSAGNAIFRDPPGMASGGRVGGTGPKGVDSEPRLLDPEEHVWTSAETDSVGGHANMYRLRAMARAGLLRRLLEGRAERFNVGGAASSAYKLRSALSRMSFPAASFATAPSTSGLHRGTFQLPGGKSYEVAAESGFFDDMVSLSLQHRKRR